MAFLSNDAKKLLKNNVANSQVLGGQPTQEEESSDQIGSQQPVSASQGLGGSSPLQPAQPLSSPSSGPAKSAASGTFTNLQKYVDKNKQSTDRLAGSVQQGLQTAADVAKKNIEQTGQQFTGELEKGSLQNRDIAQEQVRATALNAAGGVQDPEAEKQRVAAQQAAYQQQVDALQPTIQTQEATQRDFQTKQKTYEDYTKAKAATDAIKKYFGYGSTEGLWSTVDKIKPVFGGQFTSNITNTNFLDPARKSSVMQNALRAAGAKDLSLSSINMNSVLSNPVAAKKYYDSILKQSGFTNSDLLSDNIAATPQMASGDLKINQGISAQPKYYDVSKEVEQSTKALNQSIAQQKTAKELAKFIPKAIDIPAILAQGASQDAVSDDRVKEILNAIYKGPQALHEIKSYDKTLQKSNLAERRLGQVSKKGVDSQLLQDLFSSPERDYSRGERTLDSAILGQSGKVNDILDTKKNIGSVADFLANREAQARGEAGIRSADIDRIRQASRGTLQDIATGRSGQVEQRLGNVVEGWNQLPEYLKTRIKEGMANGGEGVELSGAELALLGANSGTGLYNSIRDVGLDNILKTTQADKSRLISQAEQSQLARLQALSQLSDDYNTMGGVSNFANKYQDASKAGTQTALDALDRPELARILGEKEQQFADTAKKSNVAVTGYGEESVEGGWGRKDKILRASRNLNTPIQKILDQMGYKSEGLGVDEAGSKAALENLAGNIQDLGSEAAWDSHGYLNDAMSGAITTDNLSAAVKNPGQAILSTMINGLKPGWGMAQTHGLTNAAGQFTTKQTVDALNNLGLGSIGRAVGSVGTGMFGGSKGNAQRVAQQRADTDAVNKLKKATQNWFTNQGFQNRLYQNIDDAKVLERMPELAKLLAGLDLTNTSSKPSDQIAQAVRAEDLSTDQIMQKIMASNRK